MRQSSLVTREEELVEALKVLSRRPQLPDLAELEPGAFLYLVKSTWEQVGGRDGRRGHLSETRIAALIADAIGHDFTRNQYQAMFGEGRRLGGIERYSQPVPRDVAEGFLRIAFNLWKRPPATMIGVEFLPIVDPANMNLDAVVENACDAMYGSESEADPVYCRPSQGRGAIGLYRHSGHFRSSLLLASLRDPIVIQDPEQEVLLWQHIMRCLLIPPPDELADDSSENPEPIHIWAFREPVMRHDGRSAAAVLRLGRLRSVLMWTRGVAENDPATQELWNAVDARCVIAIRRLQPPPQPTSSIVDDLIFPSQVPERWLTAGAPARIDALMSIVCFEREDRPEYHVTDTTSKKPAVIDVSSPGHASDQSFSNLFKACRVFTHRPRKGSGRGHDGCPMLDAVEQGWLLLSPSEFLNQTFPLPRV